MIKVFTKTVVTGNGNEGQAFQSLADKVLLYLKEQNYTSSDVKWMQSSDSARVTLTAIVG